MLAFASHGLQASRKKLDFHPGVSHFNGEHVGAAILVTVLDRAEQILGDLQPKQIIDARKAGTRQKKLPDPADVGG